MTPVGTAPWLRCFAGRPEAKLRLVCFPHAGGGANVFHGWAKAFPPEVEVWAVRYPGREDRPPEEPLVGIEALAEQVSGALTHLADKPMTLLGHSMGALVAFETVRQNEAARLALPITRLLVSSSPAPGSPLLQRQRATDDETLLRELKRGGGTDDAIFQNTELLAMILDTLRSDYRRLNAYRPSADAAVGCPITAIGGADDDTVGELDLGAWQAHTNRAFDLHMLPGGHFHLFTNPAVAALVERDIRA